jgi:glycosyltransferase involved in cell wall biosynthesis
MSEETEQPWLSIITVVKDDPIGFERTRSSVLSQTLKNFEWVVVDSSAEPLTQMKDAIYSWVEPEGIFPAMNIGINLSAGTFVYFLNAGDIFMEPNSIEQVLPVLTKDCDALICDVLFVYENGDVVLPPPLNMELEASYYFARGRFPPHQGLICRRTVLTTLGGFNTQFKIAADFDLFLRVFHAARVCYEPLVIAKFYTGGTSSKSWVRAQREFHKSRVREFDLSLSEKVRVVIFEFVEFAKQGLARLTRRV